MDEWWFWGPARDDWPGKDAYVEAERKVDLSAIGLAEQWREWLNAKEQAWLDEWGDAGFELVAAETHETPAVAGLLPSYTTVRAWFKRERVAGNPEPPKPIGFRPPE